MPGLRYLLAVPTPRVLRVRATGHMWVSDGAAACAGAILVNGVPVDFMGRQMTRPDFGPLLTPQDRSHFIGYGYTQSPAPTEVSIHTTMIVAAGRHSIEAGLCRLSESGVAHWNATYMVVEVLPEGTQLLGASPIVS